MQPKKHYFAHIPTIAILVLFAMSGPLGVLLFILKHIDKDAEKKELADAAYAGYFRAEPADSEHIYGHDMPTQEQKKAKLNHQRFATLCAVVGGLFLLAGLQNLLFEGFDGVTELLTYLAQILGGGGALWMGLQMNRTRKLERLLDKIVRERDNIPLSELFAAAGVPASKGRPAVESAIEHGYFGADAYIDNRTDTLVVRGVAPQPPKPEPQPAPAAPEDTYASLLRQLKEANDAIPDAAMTAKIARLETLSARIFELARRDSDKKAQLQKFMDYYLPTVLKLLRTYAQLPAQDVQGQNIAEARSSIERSMDLLITAFENQLDKLFASDALDVTTDIAALEGMLGMDGLTDTSPLPQ